MKVTSREIENYLKILEESPRLIASMIRDIDEARLKDKSGKEIWSVNDILAHLRSCADVWGNSIAAMLAEDIPMLPDIHPRKWIKGTNYLQLPFHESFQAFREQRERLLITLNGLAFEAWSRAAMIGGREHTVFTQARRMAKHEQEHCEQIESLLRNASQR
jgi:hypothetical protein